MKKSLFFPGLLLSLLLLSESGCYQYAPPDPALLSRNFARPPSEEGGELLRRDDFLSLAAATQIALVNNPNLTSALHAANAARMRYYQALGLYSPVIKANFNLAYAPYHYGTIENPIPETATNEHHFNVNVGADATWLLFDGLVREFTVLSREAAAQQQKQLEFNVARLLKRAVAYAYNDIILAQEQQRIYRSDLEFQTSNLGYAEARLKYGGASLNEVLNFRILAAAARARLLQANYQYEVARYALSALMGYPEGTLPEFVRFPPIDRTVPPYPIPVDAGLELAVSARPDLAAVREAVAVAKYQKYAAYGAYLPTVTAFAQVGYTRNHTNYSGNFIYDHSLVAGGQYAVGVTSEYLIFNGFSRYNKMREMQALYAAAQFDLAEKYLATVEEVRAAYANFENLREQAGVYRDMMNWVFEQRKLVAVEYNSGHVVVTRLNEAQNDLVSAESNYVSSLAAYHKARAALDAAIYNEK